jgi:hypothetical protein
MTRYNPFHRIHKALRALLYDTSLLLQRTDFTIEQEAEEAVARLQVVITLFQKYQFSEDRWVLPAMMAYEPGVAVSFEEDHEEAYEMGNKVAALVENLRTLSLPIEKQTVGAKIMAAFEDFLLFNVVHLSREEQFINKMMWRYYTDAELQKIAWEIIGATDPSVGCTYSRWLFRGLNNNEIIRWLKEVRTIARENDFNNLLKTAEAELHPRRWYLLQPVIATVGAMV